MLNKKKEFYSEVDQIADTEAFLESVKIGFSEVQDPRCADNQSYPLTSLLLIILCAVLAGANTIQDISIYARTKQEMFKQILKIERAPCYNVFWWLLTRMDPNQLERCMVRWIQSLPDEFKEKLIAIDGKHLKGAAKNGSKIHLVSAWESNRSLLLGQKKADEKSNEITAIPELLDSLDIEGATVTIDAAGCQTEIVEKIRDRNAHYFIALKGNQGLLCAEANSFFTQARNAGYEEASCERYKYCEKGHGRIVEYEVVVTNQLEWLECKSKWRDLTSFVEVTSHRTQKGKTSVERRFYMSDRTLDPEQGGQLSRGHWSIENRLHWNMDVNFKEDACLAATGNAAENFAVLRRLASTLIRIDLGGVLGTARRRKQATWDDYWTLRLLSRIFQVEI